MALVLEKSVVSVDWLLAHLEDENLIILDCTIPKVTSTFIKNSEKIQIKGARFFDIKKVFSDNSSAFPNTVLKPETFQQKAQELGINRNSIIVCYDDLGIYASARVWWNFKLMGFDNIAVLNGGFPAWKAKNYPIEKPFKKVIKKGDFKANFQPKKLKFTVDVLNAIDNKNIIIADARSKGRFYATEPEPRNDVKTGHIPNSISLPYTEILENGFLKPEAELKSIFNEITNLKDEIIFTCGSGITASILALGASISGVKNYAVYDGSWTEWGLTPNLPIEK